VRWWCTGLAQLDDEATFADAERVARRQLNALIATEQGQLEEAAFVCRELPSDDIDRDEVCARAVHVPPAASQLVASQVTVAGGGS